MESSSQSLDSLTDRQPRGQPEPQRAAVRADQLLPLHTPSMHVRHMPSTYWDFFYARTKWLACRQWSSGRVNRTMNSTGVR